MKRSTFLLIVFAIFGLAYLWNAKFIPQVIFRGQTEDEAFRYVIQAIKALPYYKKYGYRIVLPEHEAFKKNYENSDDILRIDEDFLKTIFSAELYDRSVFKEPLKAARQAASTINKALQKLTNLEKNWGFVLKSRYEIVFASYGAEATHQCTSELGKISILASSDITSKEGLETMIIHKIVNIGIEKNIIKKYNLGQWQKERIIDLTCMLYLNDIIPYYRPNNLNEKYGDKRVDEFVDKQAIVQDLPAAIEKFKAFWKE